ncbi:MAG: 30S ribosomal protein S8 [Eubacteriaceae bacterium]|nr:30S ribosomal protein S8 [Eubacteriaceae bacterium]
MGGTVTDPIADMLTRIRNANNAKLPSVIIPASNIKKNIAQIMLDEGYIQGVKHIADNKQGLIEITLKYGVKESKVISGLKRISKPGLRIYASKDEVPKVLNGLGVAIISTSNGIMTDRNARKSKIGGEVLCYIW